MISTGLGAFGPGLGWVAFGLPRSDVSAFLTERILSCAGLGRSKGWSRCLLTFPEHFADLPASASLIELLWLLAAIESHIQHVLVLKAKVPESRRF